MDYEQIVSDLAQQVFDAIAPRITPEDMERVRQAYLLAKEAHAPQKRKSGEPYILHPISVALIAAKELQELYPDRKIYVVDTLCAALGQGLLVYYASQKRAAGMAIEELAAWLEAHKRNLS